MSALSEFQKASALMPDPVVKNLTPLERDQLPTKNLYHISLNDKIRTFIPQVSARTIEKEDVRLPRVCTAGNLLACLLGYGAMWRDYYNEKNDGWFIYGFDFELAFKPNKRLLPDQKETDELWLITYSKDTVEYKPNRLGTLKLVQYHSMKHKSGWVYRLGFLVDCKAPVWITDKVELPAGRHLVVVNEWKSGGDTLLAKLAPVVTAIDGETYDKILAGKVSVLGQMTPQSANW